MSDDGTSSAPGPLSREAGADDDTRLLRVVSGAPTPEELAAVTAVLTALEAAEAARENERVTSPETPTAWSRSRRSLRTPLDAGPGRWRAFSG
ncbi:acyl-CoA carboxylase subunit epsilon [Frigoribacterium sp. 2-23]|uniref:acyl-CoA carboxylase subunit epsilon n=1 Tax=Frigoribacterium sp. 2-23 TaxID=3415006 RepID=UPI003C6ECA68